MELILLDAFINMPDSSVFFANLIIFFLIGISALMSASEIAFFSLTQVELDNLRESDNSTDNRVAKLLDRPRNLLSTILVINNLANVGIIITSYFVTKKMFNFFDIQVGPIVFPGVALEFIWNIVLVTFFLVLFGEATPKIYATHNKLKISRLMSGVMLLAVNFFKPINFLLIAAAKFWEKRLKKYKTEIAIEEINKAIEITVENKESKQDANLLKGIVHFGNIMVKQIMRPRTEMISLDSEMNFKELILSILESGYSRYPVYKDNPDNIMGVLNIKDILEHLNQDEHFGWQNHIREPFFVPETKKIDDLLREMQGNRKHLAVVVDEFGGTSGMITLEDILEEVVGDISDEFDDANESGFKKLDDKNYLFDGKTQLVDVTRLMELENDAFSEVGNDAETLAGLVLEIAGKIPRGGEDFRYAGYKFTIITVNNNRIEKVKVTNES